MLRILWLCPSQRCYHLCMSLRERSHIAYLRPETKADFDEQKALAKNDNDRPRTAFETTLETVQAEYTEAEAGYTEATQHLKVLENDLTLLWKEIESVGFHTQASAPLMEEYLQLQEEYKVLANTQKELGQKLDDLKMECEPFQALQEAISQIHASSVEVRAMQYQEKVLQEEAASLRIQWSEHESFAAAEEERIDRDDAFSAGTQRLLLKNTEEYEKQVDAWRKNPEVANHSGNKDFFIQADAWIASKRSELKDLTERRQGLYDQKQALKAKGKQILARYDACMEEQLETLQKLADAEHSWAAANAQHQYGIAGAGESMRKRGTLSPDEPAWIGGQSIHAEEPPASSFNQAA